MHAAIILCAGLGTRLRPLTDELAKPLVPVGDRPAVAHVAEAIRRRVPDLRLVVNAFHRREDVRAWAAPEGIAVSDEHELLGTAGGVAHARALLGPGDVLVWNGDILSDLDVRELAATHARGGAEATLAVAPRPAGEGNVGIGAEGRIVRLRQERFGDEIAAGAFLGVHVLGARTRDTLPAEGCLVGDVYLPALREGRVLCAHVTDAPFLDVGTVAAYVEANARWLASRGAASWVHPDAHVGEGVDVSGSVVGRGARVLADARRSVIWPAAVVTEAIAGAVVTPRGIVRAG